jgi:hypothetical protein
MDNWNLSLHKTSDGDGVCLINTNFVMSKNLIVRGTLFLDCSIHKYTLTSDELHS